MKRRRTQVTIRMIEYELYGRQTWWPESLSEAESVEVGIKLAESGCRFMVHIIKMNNVNEFVEPMDLPLGVSRSKVDSDRN